MKNRSALGYVASAESAGKRCCVYKQSHHAHLNEKEVGKGQFLGWLLDAGQLIPLVAYGIAHFA